MAEQIDTLLILGAGGDLTSRLLLPGVASYLGSAKATKLTVIGVDRDELTPAQWRKRVTEAFESETSALAASVAESSRYLQGDATNPEDLARVLAEAPGR
ncbi:MAG: glucose-6-phosphate dehydrogenase, partial [Rhodoglobus sp.]|nr:glucose-6-phosphate dehydrogenase [Rhodoglobus sp.]